LEARKGGSKSEPMASFMEQAYSNARQRATVASPSGAHGGSDFFGGGSKSPLLPPVRAPGGRSGRTPKTAASGGHGGHGGRRVSKSAAGMSYGEQVGRSNFGSNSGPLGVNRRAPPGTGRGGGLVSLDDVYSGAAGSASELPSVGSEVPLIPPIGQRAMTHASEPPAGRHAPRSAGSARITTGGGGDDSGEGGAEQAAEQSHVEQEP